MIVVPSTSLQEKSIHIRTVLWLQVWTFLQEFEVVGYLIDRDGVSSRVVLQHTSKEALCEEETRDPKDSRIANVDPALEESQPCLEVGYIGTQGFKGRIAFTHPKVRYLSVEESL
jgi:hypothetical protein